MSDKKRILIVNNNLQLGGIQKALVNMLRSMPSDYDITLLLFAKQGELLAQLPDNVRVIEESSRFRYLGCSQAECNQKLRRGALAFVTKKWGFSRAVPFLCVGQRRKRLREHFDVAISYQHCASSHSFYGGTAEYVLHRVFATQKVCFIHCDYQNSGTQNAYNDKIYRAFDRIACVSASVRERFLRCLPDMADKCVVAPNAVMEKNIHDAAKREPYSYDDAYCNILTVARLSGEKGVDRALRAFAACAPHRLRYYIVGDGPQATYLRALTKELALEDVVFFMGATDNPYRYMKNADALLVPSYHEAAPVVFQEAKVLSLPILTTDTTSAAEMVGENFGIVCENSDVAISQLLQCIATDTACLRMLREKNKSCQQDTNAQFLGGVREVLRDA